MRAHLENVDLHITTRKNGLPTSKPAVGRFRVHPDQSAASFIEEEGKVIFGEGHSRRLMRGKGYSVWYDEKNERYLVRVTLKPTDKAYLMMAQCDFEECINFIEKKEHEKDEERN